MSPIIVPAQVFIAGHSLGGGVATLLAFAAQQFLEGEAAAAGAGPANGTAPLVSVLLVAPPSVGPPDFVARFNRLVNARRLAFEYDIVPQVGPRSARRRCAVHAAPCVWVCQGVPQPAPAGFAFQLAGPTHRAMTKQVRMALLPLPAGFLLANHASMQRPPAAWRAGGAAQQSKSQQRHGCG